MGINLNFLGAAGTVTGSRTSLEISDRKYLVDCGLFQGDKALRQRNWDSFSTPPSEIKKIFLTHAHLDHSGFLPRLVRQGYKGPIISSQGTTDLCRLLLLDAAHLEEELASFANETKYSHHSPAEPLFTKEDAERALSLFKPVNRDQWFNEDPQMQFRFLRAGHIIGASLIQFSIENGFKQPKTITFSGDLGTPHSLLMRPPVDLPETDILVLESTYGHRLHIRDHQLDTFAKIINTTIERKGVLLIPAFAVGRAQEVIFLIKLLENAKKIPAVPVILDSPMSTSAMDILLNHPEDLLLETPFSENGSSIKPRLFEATQNVNDSMLACMRDGPMIVLSAAGMLNGGRILHHLKHRISDENNTLLFIGYQAEGTKGRYVLDHKDELQSLRIHHQEIPFNCKVESLDFLSAHADYEDILAWLKTGTKLPSKIYLNHGSENAMKHLAQKIQENFNIETIPVLREGSFKV